MAYYHLLYHLYQDYSTHLSVMFQYIPPHNHRRIINLYQPCMDLNTYNNNNFQQVAVFLSQLLHHLIIHHHHYPEINSLFLNISLAFLLNQSIIHQLLFSSHDNRLIHLHHYLYINQLLQ